MGKSDRCSIEICNNDRRYPDKIVIKSHVTNFQFHGLPKDEKLYVKSGIPRFIREEKIILKIKMLKFVPIILRMLSRDADVQFYTGLLNTTVFKTIFDHLSMKASVMHYWKGSKQTLQEAPMRYSMDDDPDLFVKPGPGRKLKLEIELLLVMMRLRLGLLVHDLAFRLQISEALVSSIFITWIKLMRLELCHLIVWPSKNVIKENLPSCFKTFYPNVRCIIDCTEIFIETPSSLDTQAQCWSDYKHHCTIKFFVAITPNGMFSYVSPCYGGRASDKFIFNNCAFIFNLEPNDQVMADRGFKIKEDLMKLSMSSGDVLETSKIAIVRIYVEQAIGRLKTFRFFKNEIPISCLPVFDDIVVVCCAACNMLDPLG
ncbi:uncharacterized protein [Mytilus edulis]|uniref:uncharacterized protein n=1 Tax=Mytilus edulis TaxID=6550 RepID=UPI0039F0D1F0